MTRIVRADRRGPAVLPATVADACERARALLDQARAQADALRAQAVEEGRAQGRAELVAEHVALLRAHARELAALERKALEVAMLSAKHIVHGELSLQPDRIAEIAGPLLARLRRARKLTLRVHPEDGPALEQALAALGDAAESTRAARIELDPSISRGGCVATSDIGTLDARIETQLEALSRALTLKAQRHE